MEKLETKAVLEDVAVVRSDSSLESSTESLSSIDETQLIRRIDLRLIPWLVILNMLSFADRVGIGNARLYGMEGDLRLSDIDYILALSMFFIPYMLFEVPANICLKRVRPSLWLSSLIFLWGITTMCQGLVVNFDGLLSLRVLLGVFEAGFFPGVIFYLSSWYKRNELGLRIALFMSSIAAAGAFGGLLAAAISNMDGVAGKSAWAWIFIVEGAITVAAGALSYFIIQDFPDSARFLSEEERAFVIRRLQADDQFSAGGETLRLRIIRDSLMDYKTWLCALAMLGSAGPLYAFAFFLPSIINQLGYTATRANLLTVPVYFLACISACIVGKVADRLKMRGYINMMLNFITGVSFVVLLCSRQPALSYTATFTAALGFFSANPNLLAWISNNVEGAYKRGVSLALVIGSINVTGLLVPFTYRERDTPWYTLGHAVTLGYIVLGFVGSFSLTVLLRRENARRDRGERNEIIGDSKDGDPRNGCYESVEAAKRDKGDKWSGFRYIG